MNNETKILTKMWQREGYASKTDVSLGHITNIPLEIDVKLDLSNQQIATRHGRAEALTVIEWGVQTLAIDLNHAYNEAQRLVIEAGVTWSEASNLFPWIPWFDRNIHVEINRGFLRKSLDLNRPLIGQQLYERNQKVVSIILQSAISIQKTRPAKISKGYELQRRRGHKYRRYRRQLHQPLFKIEVASIVIESIAFTEGSFKSFMEGKLQILGLSATLLAAVLSPVATPPVGDFYKEWQFHKEIEMQVSGQPCKVDTTWKYDAESMKQASLDAFNFAKPGLSQFEKRSRICNVQLALRLAQGSPEKIDGLWGPASQEALAHFAKRHNVPADIKSEALRGELRKVFWNREAR